MDHEIGHALDDPALNPRHKFRKYSATTAEMARLYFEDGLPIQKVADKLAIPKYIVINRFRAAGYILRPWHGGRTRKLVTPIAELARLYFEEHRSTEEIARLYDISAETVARRLRKGGFRLRENAVARSMAVWRMADADRRTTFGGEERALTQAKTRQQRATLRQKVPPNERRLLQAMVERGFTDLVQQRAIGIYNMDFATDTVGIEIIGSSRPAHRCTSSTERAYFILKSGFHLVELFYREPLDPLKESGIDQIVAFTERVKRLPAHIREYRMIGGAGQLLAVFQVDMNYVP